MLFIYHVHRTDYRNCGVDQQHAVVVVAHNVDEALTIASLTPGDEGADLWFTAVVSVDLLGTATSGLPTGLILRDYPPG
jgi:hypothetical protein